MTAHWGLVELCPRIQVGCPPDEVFLAQACRGMLCCLAAGSAVFWLPHRRVVEAQQKACQSLALEASHACYMQSSYKTQQSQGEATTVYLVIGSRRFWKKCSCPAYSLVLIEPGIWVYF